VPSAKKADEESGSAEKPVSEKSFSAVAYFKTANRPNPERRKHLRNYLCTEREFVELTGILNPFDNAEKETKMERDSENDCSKIARIPTESLRLPDLPSHYRKIIEGADLEGYMNESLSLP
jgi:hypothetical protein